MGMDVYIYLNYDKKYPVGDKPKNPDGGLKKIQDATGHFNTRLGVITSDEIFFYGSANYTVTGDDPTGQQQEPVLPPVQDHYKYFIAMIITIVCTLLPLLIGGGLGVVSEIPVYAYAISVWLGVCFCVLFVLLPTWVLIFIIVISFIMAVVTYLYKNDG
jgi:hypothetical protein